MTESQEQAAIPSEIPKKYALLEPQLRKWELAVRDLSHILAKQRRINIDHFEVHLVLDSNAIMKLVSGARVRITLLWPDAQAAIKTHLNDAFSLMKKYQIRRTMEIIHVALHHEYKNDFRKLCKEQFGDIGEVIPDLIPRYRLSAQTTEIITLTDTQTGEQVSLTQMGKKGRYEGENIGLWLELSRNIREKFPQVEEA